MLQLNFALMDYVSPDTGPSGELAVGPVAVEDIDRALDAFAKVSNYITYPVDFDQASPERAKSAIGDAARQARRQGTLDPV